MVSKLVDLALNPLRAFYASGPTEFLSARKVETRFLGQSQKESKLLNNEEITATCCDINYSPAC